MRAKGPKCLVCGKQIQIMSMGTGYVKIVRPDEAKGLFICWDCTEKLGILGKLDELAGR
jgi:DNA-directed RNA polymerase subunit RPC12/RpoP